MSTNAWSGQDPSQSTDPGAYELGETLDANLAILVAGVRVFAGASPTEVDGRRGRLWSSTGVLLGSGPLPDALSPGWNACTFDEPVAVAVGDRVTATYTTGGFYAELNGAFDSAVASADGAVTFIAAASGAHGNGSFTQSPTTFPDHASPQNTFYGVDLVYDVQPSDAPVIDRVTAVAAGATVTSVVTASGDLTGASYQWNWGDGSSPTIADSGAAQQHDYDATGTYRVLVTVTTTGGVAFEAAAVRVFVNTGSALLTQATQAIVELLSVIDGVQVYTEPDPNLNTPCVVVGPPDLNWTVFNDAQPNQATIQLYLVVSANGYAVSALEPLLTAVAQALDVSHDAVVTGAVPGTFHNLPCYRVTLEASL